MQRTQYSLCLLCALGVSVVNSSAAPPVLTHLYPAGGQRGTTTPVTATGTFKAWPVNVWVDRPGVKIAAGKARGQLNVTIAAEEIPGVCWVRLHDDDGASALRPFLIGALPEVAEREPNDSLTAAQVLPASRVTVNGRLEKAGDVDVFALELRQGETLVAALEANQLLKSPLDGVLQVLSADGFVLEQNDDHRGLDPQIVFTAPRAGRYFVRLFAFPSVPTSTIAFAGGDNFIYRLTLTTGGLADHAWPLAVPHSAPGKVAVLGWNIPEATQGAAETGVVFHSGLANAVSVRLEPHSTILEKETRQREQPQVVQVPVTISGRLSRPGEVDVYEFSLKKGQKLLAQIESRTLHFPLDPVLRLTDPTGKMLKEARAAKLGADPELLISATADTIYRLEVSDLHGEGSPRHVYRLRLVRPDPDFALTVAADNFAVLPGKTLDIPVQVERRNGLAGPIELRAEGLPAGVTAETVSATATTKSVTLRLIGKGTRASGTFHIVGRVVGELVHPAHAPIAEMSTVTEHLWLTLSPTAAAAKPVSKKKK